MNREEILKIMEEEAKHLGYSLDDILETLGEVGFSLDRIVGNPLIGEVKIRQFVAFACHAM